MRNTLNTPLPATERTLHEALHTAACSVLEAERFPTFLSEGGAMSLEEALTYAIG